MRNSGSIRIALATVVVTVGVAASAAAQTNTEIFQDFQWNFSTPGARANGMGRAFIGVADDATAAVTNPAGLVSLTRPQGYFEFKSTKLDIQRLANPNSVFDLTTSSFGGTVDAVSFFSLALPLSHGVAVSFARHQFLDYQETFSYPTRLQPGGSSFVPVQGTLDFRGASYAASIAAPIGDKIYLGVTVSADRLTASADLKRLNFAGSSLPLAPGAVVSDAVIPSNSHTAGSVTVGLLYHPNDKYAIGAVYAKGPSFKMSEQFFDSNGQEFSLLNSLGTLVTFPQNLSFNVPSRAGIGAAGRPAPRLLVALDVDRIYYSDLTKDFVVTTSFNSLSPQNFAIKDRTEVHLGGEYGLTTGRYPIFVRAGVFTNADHRLTFVPTSNLSASITQAQIDSFNLLPTKTNLYGTAGVGFVFGPRLQIDLAYSSTKEFVASTAVRF